MDELPKNVIPFIRWEVYEFPWGTAVRRQRSERWTSIFLRPDGQQLNVEGLDVVLHENGIEIRGVATTGRD